MASLNPQIGDVFYIGKLSADLTDAIRAERLDEGVRASAEELRQLLQLAIAFRTGDLSEERKKTNISPADAYSLFSDALLQMPLSARSVSGLAYYVELLKAMTEGHLDAHARDELATFFASVSEASARIAQGVAAALNPGQRGGTPWRRG